MVFVVTNCQQDDYDALGSHLFKRQMVMLVKDGIAHIAIKLDSLFDLAFVAGVLKCQLLFKPFAFKFEDSKYHTLEIVRE